MFRICLNTNSFPKKRSDEGHTEENVVVKPYKNVQWLYSPMEKEAEISKTAFVAACLGFVSLGMLVGVKVVFRREQEKLTRAEARDGGMFAAKALVLGTILCTGAFAGIGALFVTATGISSVKEFGEVAQKFVIATGMKIPDPAPSPEDIEAEQSMETFLEELFTLHPLKSATKEEPGTSKTVETSDITTEEKGLVEGIRESLRKKFGKEKKSEKSSETNNNNKGTPGSSTAAVEEKGFLQEIRQTIRKKLGLSPSNDNKKE
jgi:hypothetical protein